MKKEKSVLYQKISAAIMDAIENYRCTKGARGHTLAALSQSMNDLCLDQYGIDNIIDPQQLGKYASGQAVPTLEKAAALAAALGVSLDDLVGNAGGQSEKDDDILTIGSAFNYLFDIDKNYGLSIKERADDLGYMGGIVKYYTIEFNARELDNILKEWCELKSLSVSPELKEKLLMTWKNQIVSNKKPIAAVLTYDAEAEREKAETLPFFP